MPKVSACALQLPLFQPNEDSLCHSLPSWLEHAVVRHIRDDFRLDDESTHGMADPIRAGWAVGGLLCDIST